MVYNNGNKHILMKMVKIIILAMTLNGNYGDEKDDSDNDIE